MSEPDVRPQQQMRADAIGLSSDTDPVTGEFVITGSPRLMVDLAQVSQLTDRGQ